MAVCRHSAVTRVDRPDGSHDDATRPRTWPAVDFVSDGVQALWLEGPSWQGRPTRAFAWTGRPVGTGPFPDIVLLHGGGGTAFATWVRQWVARGYVAIAIDHTGTVPDESQGEVGRGKRHAHAGAPGCGDWDSVDQPITGQWPWQAVALARRAVSWLRGQDEVNAERIALTGISWGGVITCLTAAVEDRIRCAVPVFGCGFIGRVNRQPWPLDGRPDAAIERWFNLWDPARYLPDVRLPLLWVTGTKERHFRLPTLAWSLDLVPHARLVLVPTLGHDHPQGWGEPEIASFIDEHCRDTRRLPIMSTQREHDGRLRVTLDPERPATTANRHWTIDTGLWDQRRWQCARAVLDQAGTTATASIPHDASAAFITVSRDGVRAMSRPWLRDPNGREDISETD